MININVIDTGYERLNEARPVFWTGAKTTGLTLAEQRNKGQVKKDALGICWKGAALGLRGLVTAFPSADLSAVLRWSVP